MTHKPYQFQSITRFAFARRFEYFNVYWNNLLVPSLPWLEASVNLSCRNVCNGLTKTSAIILRFTICSYIACLAKIQQLLFIINKVPLNGVYLFSQEIYQLRQQVNILEETEDALQSNLTDALDESMQREKSIQKVQWLSISVFYYTSFFCLLLFDLPISCQYTFLRFMSLFFL